MTVLYFRATEMPSSVRALLAQPGFPKIPPLAFLSSGALVMSVELVLGVRGNIADSPGATLLL